MRHLSFTFSARTLLVLFVAASLFQLCVLAGLIPTEMVWGGRLKSEEERTVGAIASLSVMLVMIAVLLVRMRRIKGPEALGRYGMWSIAVLFALNTIGNLFALDPREAWIFTPVTLAAAVLAARVAMGKLQLR